MGEALLPGEKPLPIMVIGKASAEADGNPLHLLQYCPVGAWPPHPAGDGPSGICEQHLEEMREQG